MGIPAMFSWIVKTYPSIIKKYEDNVRQFQFPKAAEQIVARLLDQQGEFDVAYARKDNS